MRRFIGIFVFFLLNQPYAYGQVDSLRVLKEEEFIATVKQFHPLAKQGALLVDIAKAELTAIRGGFDPIFQTGNERKTFYGENYYNYTFGELTVPTWYGVEIKGGFENNFGNFIDNELTVGRSSYLGLTLPLIKNLVIDKRRAALQQAKLFSQQSEYEKKIIINNLLLDAYHAYWNWAKDFKIYNLFANAVELNRQRLSLIKISFEQGDRPGMDTVEAISQLQNLQQQKTEALLKFNKSSLELSNFLWTGSEEPAYISNNVIPDSIWAGINLEALELDGLDKWLEHTLNRHPKIQSLNLKISNLEVDRKLKFQDLLPKLDLKYNFLQKGYEPWKNINTSLLDNNYKLGFNFSIPLFLRKGRGEWASAKLKLRNVSLERQQQRLEIENKIRYYYSEITSLKQQSSYLQNAYINYQKLFDLEILRYGLGETSLFILNSRQNQLLFQLQKLLEVKAKFFMAQASLQWAAGRLE
ncbi:MAG TPA: TolC family protein [Chitinophagaceae bacterium]|nr:TolC family protein [Chitinophagaceae bacterium]